ncbi:RNase H family protein [Romboutsia sp.]|uniref:RNase H family protein n=1 Tax=Romboutsia sp. TaxID=1965302 RepID=UPI002C02EE37|nr:RNase H family protein [Romboutsia sp.]HSQ87980.1 RNase H family protein [Romboutsia sp.]
MNSCVIYVDGSYNTKTEKGGYGLVITSGDRVLYEEHKELVGDGLSMRNVYGEIVGACRAVELSHMYNVKEIVLAYDYEGVEKWASGAWKRKNEYTKKYHEFMQVAQKHIKIEFMKIKSHSGDRFNDMADKLAKRGAGF